jgi:hypothetical protein
VRQLGNLVVCKLQSNAETKNQPINQCTDRQEQVRDATLTKQSTTNNMSQTESDSSDEQAASTGAIGASDVRPTYVLMQQQSSTNKMKVYMHE